jgi:hypothetical protein
VSDVLVRRKAHQTPAKCGRCYSRLFTLI